jgi:hypothetical protein
MTNDDDGEAYAEGGVHAMSGPINYTPEELLLHLALLKAWHEMWASGTTDVDLLGINPKETAR